jgi:hypothetical protein
MARRLCSILSALVFAGSGLAAASELTLTLQDGRVTLVADGVTVRQILAEWARVGQTTIVGLERLSGPPVTLRLVDVPERAALETLLRTASGYMAAPRRDALERASAYDRILILPTSAPVAASAGPAVRVPMSPPAFPAAGVQPIEEADEGSDMPEDQAPQPTAPVINPYQTGPRPPETTFDYANPQEMLRQRQQMLQQQLQQPLPQAQPPSPGTAVPGIIQPSAPAFFPGSAAPGGPQPMQPTASPGLPPGVSTRPGEMVMPPQPQLTPYGLPPGVQPGSVVPPQVEPDRAKYLNPYAPAQPPRKPPDK